MPTPTSPKKKIGSSIENMFFYVSLLALAIMISTFFYLQYMVTKSNDELASLSIEAAKSKTEDQKQLEDSVLRVQQELKDFSKLVSERKMNSEVFSRLEDVMIMGVYFYQCDLDDSTMTTSLAGHAKNLEVLGQQIMHLEEAKDILSNVTIGKIAINEAGGVDFELKAKFNDISAAPQDGG